MKTIKEEKIAIVNYSREKDGTAIAARIYHDTLIEMGHSVIWYQIADRFDAEDYMKFPNVIHGSNFPISSLRPGYDRMIYLPNRMSQIPEKKVFLSDPTLIRMGLGRNFMVKVHDINPLTIYKEKRTSWAMFKYAMPRLKYANGIIVTTDYMKQVVSDYFNDEEQVFIVPEPVNWTFEPRTQLNAQIIEKNEEKQILYVAADRPYKNIRQFLDIAAEFQKKNFVNYKFVLVSRLRDVTLEYFKKLNLKNTKVLSNVPDMKDIYLNTDILVYPSLYEGFGRPIVEAMSMGIPTIAMDISPFKEIIGSDGILLKNPQLDEWIESIISLSEKDKYEEFTMKAKNGYKQRFSADVFKLALNKAFRSFLE